MKTVHSLASVAVVSLIIGCFSGHAVAQDADLIEKAKKEGKVTYYTTRLVASMNEMARAFEAKYGIKVEASRHTNEDLIAKIVNETKAGRASADVFDGSSGITVLMDAGLVASYKPKQAEVFDAAYKDPGGHWTAVQLFVAGLSYNTDLVKTADLPKTVDDLLDPKWHGRKITYTMQFTVSGINGFYGALEKERGPEKAREFLTKLHKQGAVAQNVTPGGTADQLASGQFPLCIGCNSNQMEMLKRKGAPVEFSDVQPIVSFYSAMGITKAAANPNAARLFVEWCMSEEGQLVLDRSDNIPVRPGLANSKMGHLQPKPGKVFNVTPELVAKDLARWNKIQTEVRQ